MENTSRELYAQGTALLRKNGYTAGGRPRQEVCPEQYQFERKMLAIPTGGKPKRGGFITR